jgi:DNA-binding NarL/FixJ family response regulator
VTEGPDSGQRRRLLIAGPELLREALAALLGTSADLDVLGRTAVAEAPAAAAAGGADIVVVVLGPHGAEDVAVVRALVGLRPPVRVIALCDHCPAERLKAVLASGAGACISSDGGRLQLTRALEAVDAGRRYVAPELAELMTSTEQAPAALVMEAEERLTAREREVLRLIAEAKTAREIAVQLSLSPKTVHTHRASIMSKLRVHSTVALVRRALQLGLVRL